jgi:polysaccharide chain length determinant protein (PEP-CTERM system associated)
VEERHQRELTFEDYVAMLRRRWVLIALLTILGGPLAYGVSRFLPTRYKSQTVVLVQPPTVSEDIVKQIDVTSISQRLASMQEQILSRTRLEPVIRSFGLYPDEINKEPIETLVAKLQKAIEVTPIEPMAETGARDLPGFIISVTLDSPRAAQGVCTTITSMFIAEDSELREQHSEQTVQFLSQQLADAKTTLDQQDAKLADFKSRYSGSLPDDEPRNMNLLTDLTSQLDAANQALARAQQDKSFAESMLTQQLSAWQESQAGHNPETLQQQLVALQSQLASLQARYTDDYPDVIKTKADIAVLQKKVAEADNTKAPVAPTQKGAVEPAQIAQYRSQIHTAEQVIAEKTREQEEIKREIQVYQTRIQTSPAVEEQYKELTRGYQTALDSYNDLLKKQEESKMAGALQSQQQSEQFTILDPANLPDSPSFPNRLNFLLGGFGGGLALGVGIAFLFEMQDKSLRTERDVEFALRLPVLAMVPAIEPISSRKPLKKALPESSSSLGLSPGA